jgi:signal transduction histidine kinase
MSVTSARPEPAPREQCWTLCVPHPSARVAAAHELRTPLHAILGFAELLDEPTRSAAESEAIGSILASGRRMLDIVERMLDEVSVSDQTPIE